MRRCVECVAGWFTIRGMAKKEAFGSTRSNEAYRRMLDGMTKREAVIRENQKRSLQAAESGHREAASTFRVNNVVVINGDDKIGVGRVVEINEKTGQLTILFGKKRRITYAPTFVRKVSEE